MAALAAEAADDEPRASMMAAPRCWTVGMNSLSIHLRSLIRRAAPFFETWAWKRSGYWVAEWLPQIVMRRTSVIGTSVFLASWAIARLWSSRVMAVNRRGSILGA